MNNKKIDFKQTQIACLFAANIFLACVLLITKMIDGANFVALLVAGSMGVSIYALLPKISEFSLGGNTVKFQEKLNEAERITAELKLIKQIAIKNTLKTLSMRKEYNLLVYSSLKEYKDIYNIIRNDDSDFENYRSDLAETILTLRENVYDFIGDGLSKSHQMRVEKIKSAMPFLKDLPDTSSEKMKYHFGQLYLNLTDFIESLMAGETPELILFDSKVSWIVVKRKSRWSD
ncbi:hypothetical protein [Pantoea ananatis]|uniref:hypothetical protein n=1 Tax=Pantoea ananas TaxID=553 RepID=UPI001B30ACE2|nr:hypothetical protein [Pantoea ananatis]PKC31389.1 hypothetical protein V462_17695 [Pantoea ananatis 15320]